VNESELKAFLDGRRASPNVQRKEIAGLHCYGCAHSASVAEPPGMPSGERPCCSCIRNPEREQWAAASTISEDAIVIGNDGHARIFNPFVGTLYNGAPRLYAPMDNYVTLDHQDQERWLDEHPEYLRAIRFDSAGNLCVVDDA